MQWIVGFLILGFLVNAMGVWFWIIAAVVGAAVAYASLSEGISLTEEEKIERRKCEQERHHAMQMMAMEQQRLRSQLAIQAEHEKKQQQSAMLNGLGGTVVKLGVGLAINALTGANHRHRH